MKNVPEEIQSVLNEIRAADKERVEAVSGKLVSVRSLLRSWPILALREENPIYAILREMRRESEWVKYFDTILKRHEERKWPHEDAIQVVRDKWIEKTKK